MDETSYRRFMELCNRLIRMMSDDKTYIGECIRGEIADEYKNANERLDRTVKKIRETVIKLQEETDSSLT